MIHQGAPYPAGFYYTNLVQDTYRSTDGHLRRKAVVPVYGIAGLDQYVVRTLAELDHFDEIRTVRANRQALLGAGVRCMVAVLGTCADRAAN